MQVKSFSLKDGGVDIDARTFEGYAATWDKDLVGDIIMPGAFTKSINEAFPARRIKVLWNHAEPIGMPIEMREDERGLFVKGKISKTARGDEVLQLMRDSVVDTMSIGFIIPAGKSELSGDVRIIREVRLMEFSPVTFAANPMAAITDVKRLGEMLRSQELSDQDKKYLASFVADIQALVKAEPQSTLPASKPLVELGELNALFKKFGESLGENK